MTSQNHRVQKNQMSAIDLKAMYALVEVAERLLEKSAFDLEAELQMEFGKAVIED